MSDWTDHRLDMTNNPEALIKLYNLATEPGEENNVADENPEIVKRIYDIMKNERTPSEVFPFEYEKE